MMTAAASSSSAMIGMECYSQASLSALRGTPYPGHSFSLSNSLLVKPAPSISLSTRWSTRGKGIKDQRPGRSPLAVVRGSWDSHRESETPSGSLDKHPACRRATRESAGESKGQEREDSIEVSRRAAMLRAASVAAIISGASALPLLLLPSPPPAHSVELPGFKKDLRRKKDEIPLSDYTELPNGLKYYDVSVGTGLEAINGARVAVHFECKWRGITFQTSRQGMGVTGGNPYGFDVGSSAKGYVLPGLDLGVAGMRVGGQRKLKVPPELAYGEKGRGEIPGGATLDIDVELLSVKTSALGYQVKLVEG